MVNVSRRSRLRTCHSGQDARRNVRISLLAGGGGWHATAIGTPSVGSLESQETDGILFPKLRADALL